MAQNMLFNLPGLDRNKSKANDQKAIQKASKARDTNVKPPKKGMLINVPKTASKGLQAKIETVVQVARKLLEHDELTKKCKLLTDVAELKRYFQTVKKTKILSLDSESAVVGDKPDPILDTLAGLCFYTPGEYPAYCPVNHVNYKTGELIPGQMPIAALIEVLEDLPEDVYMIYHNAKYDIRVVIRNLKVRLKMGWCTLIASNLLNENESHALKDLHPKYCKSNYDPEEQSLTFRKLFEDVPFTMVPLDVAALYGAKDPYITYELEEFQRPFLTPGTTDCKKQKLERVAWVLHNIEFPLIDVVIDQEEVGVCFDLDLNKELSVKYNELQKIAEKEAIDSVTDTIQPYIAAFRATNPEKAGKLGNSINIGSPTQLAIILYDILKLKSPDKQKPRGTGEEIMDHHAKEHDFCAKIIAFRKVAKLLSTYIDKLPRVIKAPTGRIHGRVNQYGAKTGRQSMDNPNLQNIPSKNKEIRKMFIASPGYVMLGGDFSGLTGLAEVKPF